MRFLPPLIFFIFTLLYYLGSYQTPLFKDEIAPYFLPTIALLDGQWGRVLAYRPEYFFGHPPLYSTLHALILSLFPATLTTLRLASVILTAIGLFPLYFIGLRIVGRWGALVLLLFFVGHFNYWENANLLLPDSLLTTLALFFLLACVKKRQAWMLAFGLAMILTRETALILFAVFWLHTLVFERSFLKLSSLLLGLQLAWFVYLKLISGHLMPVYYSLGFIFEWSFFSSTLLQLFKVVYLDSWWFLLLLFILLAQVRFRLRTKFAFLPLITLVTLIGLSFITASQPRYQALALCSVFLFAVGHFWNAGPWTKQVLSLLACVLLARNLYLAQFKINHHENDSAMTQARTHQACAQKIRSLNPVGQWLLLPTTFTQVVKYQQVMKDFSFRNFSDSLQVIDPNLRNINHADFVALADPTRLKHGPAYKMMEQLNTSTEHEVLLQDQDCLIFKKKTR